MIPKRRLAVFIDFAVDEPQLAILESRVSLLDAASPIPQTLDFAAMEHHAAFDRIENLIVVLGLAVLSNTLKGRSFGRARRFARSCRARSRFARTGFVFWGFCSRLGRGWLWLFLVQTSFPMDHGPGISNTANVEFSSPELGYTSGNSGGDCPPTRLSIST